MRLRRVLCAVVHERRTAVRLYSPRPRRRNGDFTIILKKQSKFSHHGMDIFVF